MREYFMRVGEIIKQETRNYSFEVKKFKKRPPTQKELGEAYRIERQILNEAYVLLGDKDEVSMIDQRGRNLAIKSKRKLETEDKGKHFPGANLLIATFERVHAGKISYEWADDYVFYGNRVDRQLGRGVYRKGKDPEKEVLTIGANAKDLTVLLKILRESKPVK